ncbi:MAG: methyltransferase domain-containing protein [Chloroflexi bacterium]|nr:methyltransferase domain-containing protein [Chloroflexota bacterium]
MSEHHTHQAPAPSAHTHHHPLESQGPTPESPRSFKELVESPSFDPSILFKQAFWDERYGSKTQIWSGNPNQRLVEQIGDLAPGRALDVGCGEGADVVWLASRGWDTTGVDVSPIALERGERAAAEAGREIAARTHWQQVDLLTWTPKPAQFDLVSAHYIHLPLETRRAVFGRLADAVRPGGTLLIVGHHPSDLETRVGRPNLPALMFTAEEIAGLLDASAWEILTCDAPPRPATDPEGGPITIHDAVLKARRR